MASGTNYMAASSSKVFDFLHDKSSHGKGAEIALTGMGEHKGSWFVSDAEYPKLLELLADHLFVKRLRPMSLVEQSKPDGIRPLVIDLDFKYPSQMSLTRAFTTDHIFAFLKEVVSVLTDTFDLRNSNAMRFFVTLRPQPYEDKEKSKTSGQKIIKDGIHILCPDFTLSADLQSYLRWALLEQGAVANSFAGTGYINEDANVYDKALTGPKANGWMFYGESKQNIPAYKLTNVWRYTPKSAKYTAMPSEDFLDTELIKLLSIRYNLKPQLQIQESKKEDVYKQISELQKPVPKQTQQTEAEAAAQQEAIAIWEPFIRDTYPDSELQLARRLAIECFNAERADDYQSWMRVGWCLRNMDSSEEMFNAWMEFSKKSTKSAGNNVELLKTQWIQGSMRRDETSSKLGPGSLHFWARTDNPAKYSEIMSADISNYIRKVAMTFKGGTHHHVAQIMKKLFHERYMCAIDSRSTEWFEFREHTWVNIPQGIKLKEHIHNDVAVHVCEARSVPIHKDNEEQELQYRKMLLDFERNLYSAGFKDSVMKECVQLFYNEQFVKQLNQNPYTLGCANGVLHLRHVLTDVNGQPTGYKALLQPGRPTDYISLRTGMTAEGDDAIPYVPYDPADPVQGEIMDFFKKLFPAADLREYVLTLAAGCLEGANKEQCFYIMTGCGGNGKSKFVSLMTSVLGQYAGSLATTALTRKRPDSGAANPDIMGVKSCRFIEMKEPDENEPLNSARMKQFSGEDLVEARGLFKDQERFKIMGKIFMACNRMPPIHSMDGGTWRRIRVIPFNARFVNPADTPVDEANFVFARDDMLDEKLRTWRVPFFSLLVHYYQTRYCPNGIKKVPEVVMSASNEYRNTHDGFGKFMDARIRVSPDQPDGTEAAVIQKLLRAYKLWHTENNATGKRLSDNEMKIRLNERFQTPPDGKTYKHVWIFPDEETIEAYDKERLEARAAGTA